MLSRWLARGPGCVGKDTWMALALKTYRNPKEFVLGLHMGGSKQKQNFIRIGVHGAHRVFLVSMHSSDLPADLRQMVRFLIAQAFSARLVLCCDMC